jgi:endonuclease/exonuclease/phosphatase family metal-dependent hydrolase
MPTFSLLSLNIYGVPGMGTSHRIRALAEILNQEAATVVCLQEVQMHRYRRLLMRKSSRYRSRVYVPFVHAPKGGLLTLARPPVEDATFKLYQERGLWYTPALADWILHKGVLITCMTVGGLPVAVLNTHLTANYLGNWGRGSMYAEHEHRQLMELAEIVRQQPLDALVVVAGDFNVPRGSWLYESFLAESRLTDPLEGNLQPTLRHRPGMPARYEAAIDYALVRTPPLHGLKVESRLRFEDKVAVNGRADYLSDHMGVELRVSWEHA